MSEYYKKYLKYKNKYINLQKQIGGNSFEEIVRRISNFMSSIVVPLNNSYIGFNYEFSQDDNKKSFAKSCDSYTNSPEVDKIRFVKWLNNKYTEKNEIDILRMNPIFFLFYIKIIDYIIDNEPTDDIKEHIKIIIHNSRQLIKKLKLELELESSYLDKIGKRQIFGKATEDLIQLKLQMLELSIDNPEHPGHKSNPFHDLYFKLRWGKFEEANKIYNSLTDSNKKNFDSIHKQLRPSEMSIYIRFLLYKENYNEAITFVIDLDPDILNELKNKFNSIQGKTPHQTSFYNYIDFLTSHSHIDDSALSFHKKLVEGRTPKEIKIMLDTFIGNKQFDEARKLVYSLNRLIKIDILRLMANSRPETIRMYKEILILDDLFLLFEDDIYGP